MTTTHDALNLTIQEPPPPICSNLFNLDLTVQRLPSPDIFNLSLTVQPGPLYRDTPVLLSSTMVGKRVVGTLLE